ncbi:SGNH/GDSL hydrolase family protein [Roseimaritima ulvae]|uniref:SGNH hydrolase-type esterase domain-containing protein n=1 Tax=Roseimaritima ulvae TaxID=980254 RepID=A0A5B9QM68_9BACT|nr:SGNH/GDSL hydrolase family protein [Roseimaritima ulvae]QEG39149.1 hypothetical protein UC8_11100 [Roseimaritima ulvae]
MSKRTWMPSRRRLWTLACVALLCVSAGVAYIQFFLLRPVGSGPAGPAVASEPFEQVWTERPVLLLGVGDSVTAGLGADTPAHSYFNRLAENPDDEYADMRGKSMQEVYPNLTRKNIAVSGTTSLAHYHRLQDLGEPQPEEVYGVVVMTTGGNDIIHNYGRGEPREGAMYGASYEQAEPWIENFEQRLNEMLDMLVAHFPGGCEIFLADIYDPTDGVGDAPSVFLPAWPDGLAIHSAYNERIRRVAVQRDNVHLVPMHAAFLGHGSHCRQFWREHYCSEDPHYWFYSNIEDPNDRGYDAIRRVFLKEMVKWSLFAPRT